jgi:hypothetical protein
MAASSWRTFLMVALMTLLALVLLLQTQDGTVFLPECSLDKVSKSHMLPCDTLTNFIE